MLFANSHRLTRCVHRTVFCGGMRFNLSGWSLPFFYINMYKHNSVTVMKIESSIHFLPLTYQIFNRVVEMYGKKNYWMEFSSTVRGIGTRRDDVKPKHFLGHFWNIYTHSASHSLSLSYILFVVIIKKYCLAHHSIVLYLYCLLLSAFEGEKRIHSDLRINFTDFIFSLSSSKCLE